jgi:peptide-methionine (S)-S-oxide reductase
VEEAFRTVPGVVSTRVGYAGGHAPAPTYREVCRGATGHAETLEVDFDPDQVSYDELLEVFWSVHDPTQLNRQGPDGGNQYRSTIFVHSPEQEAAARASKERVQGRTGRPIVTEIMPASELHVAEEYHQRYFEKRRSASFAG